MNGRLIASVQAADIDAVAALLDAGAEPNWPTPESPASLPDGRSALMWAAINREIDIVRLLLDRGVGGLVVSQLS